MTELIQLDELLNLIKEGAINSADLHEKLKLLSSPDIADLASKLDNNMQVIWVLKLLNKNTFADVFAYLDTNLQADIVQAMTDSEITTLIDELYSDDAIDLLEELPPDLVNTILNNSTAETRHILNKMLNYKEDTAGSLMTVEYIAFSKNMTVADAFKHIREVGINKETIYTCFVTDEKGMLLGRMSTKKILLAELHDKVNSLMDLNPIKVYTNDDTVLVSNLFKKYDVISLPVVDMEGILVGIITVDDILDVIKQHDTEQIHLMSAISPSDKPYLKTSPFQLMSKRIIWLLALMILDFFTATVLGIYQDTLSRLTVLAMSIPMLMGSGGNSGSQASTLVIRSIALGQIKAADTPKIMGKEFLVGLMSGIILSPFAIVKVLIIDHGSFLVAITVALALVATITIAKTIGSTLPIIAKKLKLDPAVMAAPLITTIVDISSLLIYFALATAILNI